MDTDEDDIPADRPQRRRRAVEALAGWLAGAGRLVVARPVAEITFTGGHFHPVPEVFLQIAGRARFALAGESLVLDPGTLLLMPAGLAHEERDLGGSLNLVAKLIGGRCLFHLGEGAVSILPDAVASDLAPFANRALGDAATIHPDDPAHALALVVAWAHQIRHLLASGLPSVGSSDPASRALLFISEHLADAELGAATVAAHVGLSIDHSCRRFRAATGSTVQAAIISQRLDAAERLLAEPGMTVALAARACGFSDPDYLARCFRRRNGLGPRAWRRDRLALTFRLSAGR